MVMKWAERAILRSAGVGLFFLLAVGAGPAFCQSLEIAFQVDPRAQITKFVYGVKYWEPASKDCLILDVTVKNISDKPEQFKVSVKAEGAPFPAAAFLPVSGNPPQLAAEKEDSTSLPLLYDKVPPKILLRVERAE